MGTGRPSTYSQDLADKICEEIADGKSMRTICAEDGMPAMSSVFKWLREHKIFSEQYAKAKEEQAEAFIEDMLDISDTVPLMTERGVDTGSVNHLRLRVDTRKWIASKLKPKKYGEKLDLTSDGEKLQQPPQRLVVEILNAPDKR